MQHLPPGLTRVEFIIYNTAYIFVQFMNTFGPFIGSNKYVCILNADTSTPFTRARIYWKKTTYLDQSYDARTHRNAIRNCTDETIKELINGIINNEGEPYENPEIVINVKLLQYYCVYISN